MNRRTLLLALATVAGAGLSAPFASLSARAQRWRASEWVKLGTHTVKVLKTDQDVITVGATYEQGYWTAVRLEVAKNRVHFKDVKVIYGNNEEDHLSVDKLVDAGQNTGPLELKLHGNQQRRAIKSITLTYQTAAAKWWKGRAIVDVWGRHG